MPKWDDGSEFGRIGGKWDNGGYVNITDLYQILINTVVSDGYAHTVDMGVFTSDRMASAFLFVIEGFIVGFLIGVFVE